MNPHPQTPTEHVARTPDIQPGVSGGSEFFDQDVITPALVVSKGLPVSPDGAGALYDGAHQAQAIDPTAVDQPPLHITAEAPAVPDIGHSHRGLKIGAAVMGLALGVSAFIGGGVAFLHGLHEHQGAKTALPVRPPVTAAPFKHEATTPSTAEVPTSTTLKSVELSSPTASPSTTAVVRTTVAPEAKTTTTVTKAEAITPEKQLVSKDERAKIIAATGYDGLANYNLEIADQYDSATAHNVIIGLNGAKIPVPIDEIRADITKAENNAAQQNTFTVKALHLSPAITRDVTFKEGPNPAGPNQKETRYYIFTGPNQDLDSVTSPVTGFPDSSTIKASKPGVSSVSIIKDHGAQKIDGVSATRFYWKTELNVSTTTVTLGAATEQQLDAEKPDMSYLTNLNLGSKLSYWQQKQLLANLGAEISAGSKAYADTSAYDQISYGQYSSANIPLRAYSQTGASFFTVPSSAYGK